ncbi:MAG: hypothetical protein OEL79_11375, partial [Chromatiales bacterium]|nr:hypothetical protein [Chromatiales bacterium]
MKIRTKLISTNLIIASFMISIGIVASYTINKTGTQYKEIMSTEIPLIEILDRVRYGAIRIIASTSEYGFVTAEHKAMRQETSKANIPDKGAGVDEVAWISIGKKTLLQALFDLDIWVKKHQRMRGHLQKIKTVSKKLIYQSNEITSLKEKGAYGQII